MTDRPAPGYTPARGEAKFPDLTLHKLAIEGVPAREPGKRRHEVPPGIADHPLHIAFVVTLAGTAVAVLEEVIPRVANNDSFDGPRRLSGQARRAARWVSIGQAVQRIRKATSGHRGPVAFRRWMRRSPVLGPLDVGLHDGAPRSYPATKIERSNGSLLTTLGIMGLQPAERPRSLPRAI